MTTLIERRTSVASAISEPTYKKRLWGGTPDWTVKVLTVPYRPIEIISDDPKFVYTANPTITVVGVAYDEDSLVRGTKVRHLIMRVFLEALIEPKRKTEVDDLLDLADQVLESCSNVKDWIRMEAVRDEHGMPYLFHVIREKSLFQAIMQPVYADTAMRTRSQRRF